MRREVSEAAIVPFGYGVAYWRWDRPVAVCYPVPINVLVSLARRFWFALVRFGGWSDPSVQAYIDGLTQGRKEGAEIRYQEGRTDAFKEVALRLADAQLSRRQKVNTDVP